jgi:hypothetical protein
MSIDADPRRWKNADPATPEERWLQRALRAVPDGGDLAGRRLQRAEEPRVARWPARRGGRRAWALALVAALVGAVATTTLAALYRGAGSPGRALPAPPARTSQPRRQPRAAAPASAPIAVPTDDEPPVTAPAPIQRRQPALPRRLPVPVEEPVAPSSVSPPASDEAGEGALINQAIWQLRGAANPAAALERIAEHDRRYGAGRLDVEATLVRVEALSRLGRSNEALLVLDGRSAEKLARPLLLVRGELRADQGRCTDAIADLSRVLDVAADRLAERGLYARAACRFKLGELVAAREDLVRYREQFPTGPRRREVDRLLAPR